jgi:hypothetical protein
MSWKSASVSASRSIDCAITGRAATATMATSVSSRRSAARQAPGRARMWDGDGAIIAARLAPRV